MGFCFFAGTRTRAATGGSMVGTVKDQSGAVIPGAALTLINLDLTTTYKAETDAQGFYSFPNLPVGRYELTIEANSLLGTLGKGVNNNLLDTPEFTPGPLEINTNPRNGRPEFDTALFKTETLGQLGNARRRFFYGPGIDNFDAQLTKTVRFTESKSLDLRIEAFNLFNHAQFYGPASVDGEVNDLQTFGHVVSAVDPRLVQLAAKFTF